MRVRCVIARVVFVLFLFETPHGQVLADCPDTTIDVKAVRSLLMATDSNSLDNVFSALDSTDPAILALYRLRRLDLEPTQDEEIRYLKSLPRTSEELYRVYTLADMRDLCDHPYLSRVVYGMFDKAAQLVIKHGRFHRLFIELVDMTDGELGEIAWPAYDVLLEKDTVRTLEVLRELPAATRTRICGGVDPIRLKPHQAKKLCSSEL